MGREYLGSCQHGVSTSTINPKEKWGVYFKEISATIVHKNEKKAIIPPCHLKDNYSLLTLK